MTRTNSSRLAALIGAALAGAACAGQAQAVELIDGQTASNVLAIQSIDLNTLSATQTLNGVGTLTYTGLAACTAAGASCSAMSTLNGPNGGPAVGVNIDQSLSAGPGGGNDNYAELYYYVRYNGPAINPVTGQSYAVQINMSDTLNPGAGQAQAYFGFGVAQLDPNGFPAIGTGVLSPGVRPAGLDGSMLSVSATLTDCASGPGYGRPNACFEGAGSDALNAQPLTTLNTTMVAGTWYLVDIWTAVNPANSDASAFLDPTFSAASGSFSYDPDVGLSAAVPEPATWAMMLAGVGGLGAALRRRRRQTFAEAL